ncbi:MAG: threonylcarbamoyl-AMP synthase [Bacteroidales bacterium]|nr:threonylcarbamoyl-AMP synthase [Bacteroidales bacterium]
MIVKVYPENPNPKAIAEIVDVISDGGVVVYPTDTVYSFGCSIYKPKAIERIAQIKGLNAKKHRFSFIFENISNITQFTKSVDNKVFKILKKNLPGPFTFVLEANTEMPKHIRMGSSTIGVRIPENNIPLEIVKLLGEPIISTSVYDEDELIEYTTDPELIAEKYQNVVDLVVDGGFGNVFASTIVDCTNSDEPVILRKGLGELQL